MLLLCYDCFRRHFVVPSVDYDYSNAHLSVSSQKGINAVVNFYWDSLLWICVHVWSWSQAEMSNPLPQRNPNTMDIPITLLVLGFFILRQEAYGITYIVISLFLVITVQHLLSVWGGIMRINMRTILPHSLNSFDLTVIQHMGRNFTGRVDWLWTMIQEIISLTLGIEKTKTNSVRCCIYIRHNQYIYEGLPSGLDKTHK